MSWSGLTVRSETKRRIAALKQKLGKSSYSDVIDLLVEEYRRRGEREGAAS